MNSNILLRVLTLGSRPKQAWEKYLGSIFSLKKDKITWRRSSLITDQHFWKFQPFIASGPATEFGTMIRSYKRQVSNACLKHYFQPCIIDHCSIKSFPNSEIDAFVIWPCEFLSIEAQVNQSTSLNDVNELQTFSHIVRDTN